MRQELLRALGSGLAVALSLADARTATASVQDYQIRRLLSYHSDCRVTTLELRSPAQAPPRFHAECEDLALYPAGVDVECSDRDDERSCQVLTQAQRFDSLNLLVPSAP